MEHDIQPLRLLFETVHATIRTFILFAHENLAFCVRDLLCKVRRKTLAVVVLQQDFPTQLSAKKRVVHRMLNFHVRRVYSKHARVIH